MTDKLTQFEYFMLSKDDSIEFDIDNDNDCIGLLDSINESFEEVYTEMFDNILNALFKSEEELDVLAKEILNQSVEDPRPIWTAVTAASIREYLIEVLAEAVYKLEGQDEQCDIRAAKVYKEIQGMV